MLENLFHNGYCNSIKKQRDYGQMNWGDWFGERGCNWGNHEYDTAKQILMQFARTGDPKYFYVGDTAARHTSEVDVIHFINDDLKKHFEEDFGRRPDYPVRPGMVHQHCVGHVSGFYSIERIRELYVSLGIGNSKRPYLCLDPYNLGHIWTQGMVYDYFLTGDPWMKETVEKIGENLVKLVEQRKFNFKTGSHIGRRNGWTMLAIAGAYELDLNERYFYAMKLLADDAMSAQNPQSGGWLWRLPSGHCNCKKKHIGEAGFISSVRINGLSRYYQLSGDERIPEVIKRAVTHLNNDTWIEQRHDWRYTSCPKLV
ncbi:MAG: exo-rhamnogalacturonan lyase family protein [Planctomycetota bacterium]